MLHGESRRFNVELKSQSNKDFVHMPLLASDNRLYISNSEKKQPALMSKHELLDPIAVPRKFKHNRANEANSA